MKKWMLVTAVTLFMAGTIITAYGQQAQSDGKVTKAKENVQETKKDLADVKKASASEYRKFKKEAQAKIAGNSKMIERLKAQYPPNSNSEVKAQYYRKVAALEQKNNDLKKRIKEYKADRQSNWREFKTEFNHDMNDLGYALKGFVSKSK